MHWHGACGCRSRHSFITTPFHTSSTSALGGLLEPMLGLPPPFDDADASTGPWLWWWLYLGSHILALITWSTVSQVLITDTGFAGPQWLWPWPHWFLRVLLVIWPYVPRCVFRELISSVSFVISLCYLTVTGFSRNENACYFTPPSASKKDVDSHKPS